MDKTIEEIFNSLKKYLSFMDNTQLFNTDKEIQNSIEDLCVKYLKYLGYKVAKRPKIKNFKRAEDLVIYFYSLMEYHHSEFCSLTSSRKRDVAIISNFINYRKVELQCSTKAAMNDCALIMTTIVQNEDTMGLDRQIGIGIFGTDKCKWITDKAITLMNQDYTKYNESVMEARAKEFSSKNTKICSGYDIEEIKERRGLNG